MMALGNVVARLLVRLGLDKKEFDSGVSDAKTKTKELTGSLNQVKGASDLLTGALKGAGALGLAYLGREALSTAWNLGELGAEALRVESSFDDLSVRIGMTGDALLSSLRATSEGTVSDMDLMRTTSGLLASGIQADTRDITDALEIARLKAQQFGLTTTEAYERMLTGARKFSVEMLDEIGFNIKAESAYRRKAEAMGVAVSALNDAQRAEALWQAILEDGREEMAQYGKATGDMADDIIAAQVAIENARTEIEKSAAPFVADIAEYIPGAIENLRLFGGVLSGVIDMNQYWEASIEAERIELERGIEASRSFINEVLRTGEVVQLATNVHGEWANALGQLPGTVEEANDALEEHATAILTINTLYKGMQALPQKVFDLAGPRAAEAWEILQKEKDYAEQEWLENSIRRLHGFEDENEDVAANVAGTWESAYDEMSSAVEAALTPTSVTAWDMHLTSMGEYTDKWDENARRLDAIAQGGFGELDAHPDWAAILKIPEAVLDAGDDALKAWARQTAGDVRNLFRPDLLNVEAAADAVEAYMQEQAARELTIDMVIGELVARGGMTKADAEKQVRQAYGFETEPVDIPVNLVSAVAGDEGEGWSAAADEMVLGLREGITSSSMVVEFVSYFKEDIADNATLLSGAGEALWNSVELGILVRLDRADYASLFVSKLGPLVGSWLLENSYSTQGEGEP